MTRLALGVTTLLLLSLSACMPAALRRHVSEGGGSMAGAWNDGGEARPSTFGKSPAAPQHPPQIATVPGMPPAGVAPYHPRISTFVAGMFVYSLVCIAPDGPMTAPPVPKAPIHTKGDSPLGDATINPKIDFRCNEPTHR